MEKPVIFFSHSSKDKDYLIYLKNKILSITSNTIEIFQSSDGESIPFGNNWIHRIEHNLINSKIMFVFISPNSIKSNWIYFESGYSYSKGIKVIPIGINGIDIGKLAPPINLLQGFNINSFEGLNNLIAIINREFSVSFSQNFNTEDYKELMNKSDIKVVDNFYSIHLDYISTEFNKNLTKNKLKESAYEDIHNIINNINVKKAKDYETRLYLPGMLIYQEEGSIFFNIDPFKVDENLKLIIKFLDNVYTEKADKYYIKLYFNDEVDFLTQDFKLSSRLSPIGIEMNEASAGLYEYKNLLFALDDSRIDPVSKLKINKKIRIVFPTDGSFNIKDMYELIDILFSQNIIWIKK